MARNSAGPAIIGCGETTYLRHPGSDITTQNLLAAAGRNAVSDAGLALRDVDGLAVASFSLVPDHAIDLAWKLGLQLRWVMDDPGSGVSALNLLQHAVRAVEAGDANNVLLVSGDVIKEFQKLANYFNQTTSELLAPVRFGGPNSLFALLTQRHMSVHGLVRADYAQIPIAQRRWAALNPAAVYRSPLDLESYLSAPIVADPLCIYDCAPIVAGANALLVSGDRTGSRSVRIGNVVASHNVDGQDSDGLSTGLAALRDRLFSPTGCGARDMDVLSIYDDYPVMVLVQLADLGYFASHATPKFIRDELPAGRLAINTSGGQLSAGQAGTAGSMHGIVEAVRQLRGEAGARQVPNARTALVTGYGSVLYRYGASAAAAVLEAPG